MSGHKGATAVKISKRNQKITITITGVAPRASEILPAYANMVHLVERLHRRLMDVVTDATRARSHQERLFLHARRYERVGRKPHYSHAR